jgi:hypothetical protein
VVSTSNQQLQGNRPAVVLTASAPQLTASSAVLGVALGMLAVLFM